MTIPLVGAAFYTVSRFATGTWSATGDFVPGAESTFVVRASLQPATQEALEGLELGGERVSADWLFFTPSTLLVLDIDAGQRGDRIATPAGTLEVTGVADWTQTGFHGLKHRAYLCELVGADDGTA